MMAHRIWKAIGKRILIYTATIYGAVVLILFLVQSHIVYQPNIPTRKIVATPASIGLYYETLRITTEDGPALHGWFIRAQKERATLLFFHGNAGNISHRLDSIRIFNELGLSTLIFDYRGFGQSGGTIRGRHLSRCESGMALFDRATPGSSKQNRIVWSIPWWCDRSPRGRGS